VPDESSELDSQLLERYLTGECTPAERDQVDAWVAADPTHAAELERLRSALTDWADAGPTANVDAAWSRMAKRMAAHARTPSGAGSELRIVRVERNRGARWRGVAAAAVLIVGLGSVVVWRRLQIVAPSPTREFAAGVAERTTVTLDDGTRVTLAPASRLRVPAHAGRADREVILDGEGAFTVRHDAAHPFEVRTANGVIRDIGTTFVVRDYPTDNELDVVVAEGSVTLQPVRGRAVGDTLRPPVVLIHGQRAQLVAGAEPQVTTVDADQYQAWTTGRLVFRDTPLRQVVSELARWYDLDIRLTDPSIGNLRLTTSFTDQPLSEVLDAVGVALQVHVARTGRVVTITPRRGT
jgi:transmembrane sensor